MAAGANGASLGAHDTFPKLLLRNAKQFGDRPAFRLKDLGIWQTWTWKESAQQVRELAMGLHKLGIQRGDVIQQRQQSAHRFNPFMTGIS